jgi:hypothetical protein
MIIDHIAGATRVLGKGQGYIPLPLRDEIQTVRLRDGSEHAAPFMVTAWQPTPQEMAAIAKGAPIYLHLQGRSHPPVRLEVGEPPE